MNEAITNFVAAWQATWAAIGTALGLFTPILIVVLAVFILAGMVSLLADMVDKKR